MGQRGVELQELILPSEPSLGSRGPLRAQVHVAQGVTKQLRARGRTAEGQVSTRPIAGHAEVVMDHDGPSSALTQAPPSSRRHTETMRAQRGGKRRGKETVI